MSHTPFAWLGDSAQRCEEPTLGGSSGASSPVLGFDRGRFSDDQFANNLQTNCPTAVAIGWHTLVPSGVQVRCGSQQNALR